MNTAFNLTFNGESVYIHLLILLAALGLAWFTYRAPNPPISKRMKYFLLSLRTVILTIVIAALLEPLLNLVNRRIDPPVVAILVDQSNSMLIDDEAATKTGVKRAALADQIVAGDNGLLDRLESRAKVSAYRFAKNAEPLDQPPVASLNETNIGQALKQVDEDLVEQNLTSIILVSDGINNAGSDPTRLAATLKAPVYTVGIGDPSERKDIAITRFLTNETAYVDNEVPVEATIRSNGYNGVTVPVQIHWNGRVVAEEKVTLRGASMEQKVTLRFTPVEAGEQRFSLRIPAQAGELLAQNNVRDFVIKVLKNKIQILLIAGRPSLDNAFLNRALERDSNIETTFLMAKKGGGFLAETKANGEKISALPANPEALFQYDLVILSDIHRQVLGAPFEQLLVRFVRERGGALLMTGGDDSFQGGGYGESPIGEILPVNLAKATVKLRPGNFPIQITPIGLRHTLTLLDENSEANGHIWQSFPPLTAYSPVGGIKPGAEVLATLGNTNTEPLLTLNRFGKGKAMAFTGATYWQLDFLMLGVSGNNEPVSRFWSNAVRWLVSRDDIKRVNLVTDKKVYRSGESVELAVQVYDESFNIQREADVKLTLQKKGEKAVQDERILVEQEPGRYVGMIDNLAPGDYVATAAAEHNDNKLGVDSQGFTISEYSLEYENSRMNEPLLMAIAANSGGQYYTLANVESLLTRLNLREKIVETSRDIILWDHPGMFITLLFLLAIEWILRKQRGLA